MKDKDRSLKKAKRTQQENDWKIACTLRNNCLLVIKKSNSDFIQKELKENMGDSTRFWKKLRKIIPKMLF